MAEDQQGAGSSARDRGPLADGPPAPLLSIGLAVYNGARHLRASIDSLLAQDVGDLELIISDNASTDETQAICLDYASRDPRVRYGRNETNIGAAANFNRVFQLSIGEYFMWGSDDDLWDPRFARLCIERLERSPGAVMCTSRVTLIDAKGAVVKDLPYESVDTEGLPLDRRVFEMTRQFGWFDTYSVIRPSALRATRMHLPTFGMDVRLQLELLLQGDSLVVPEKLRSYRLPAVSKTASDYVSEIDPVRPLGAGDDELKTPWTYLARELLKVVGESHLDDATTRRIGNDLVETLTLVNVPWGDLVVSENGADSGPGSSPGARRAAIRSALGLGGSPAVLEPPQTAWQPHEGMRFSAIRRLLLRLLQPFGDRQNESNARHADAIELLRHEVDWLNRRVRELDRERSRRDGPQVS